jgi:hypothetical protein
VKLEMSTFWYNKAVINLAFPVCAMDDERSTAGLLQFKKIMSAFY